MMRIAIAMVFVGLAIAVCGWFTIPAVVLVERYAFDLWSAETFLEKIRIW